MSACSLTRMLPPLQGLACLALLLTVSAAPNYNVELYEGSFCRMEDGSDGKCIPLPKCPKRIQEVKQGKRFSTSSGRCSFENFVEIVCCPLSEVEMHLQPTTPTFWTVPPPTTTATTSNTRDTYDISDDISSKLGVRPADAACQEFERKVTGGTGQQVNPWIFEGENAAKGEFPHIVALGYKTNKNEPDQIKYNCGGTLITVQHVLTAAHCVININNYVPVEAKLGAVNLDDNSNNVQNIKISESFTHPCYKPSLDYYDIAVLKLERPVDSTQFVKPVCLQTKPLPNLSTLVNMSLVVTGWGATSFENEGSNVLQKTPSLQLIERLECAKFYKDLRRLPRGIDDSMICLLDKNVTRRSDACQGDSGGPLLYGTKHSSTVLGVTSFGQSCGSDIPGVYTNVIFYLDWIEAMVWPNRKRAFRHA